MNLSRVWFTLLASLATCAGLAEAAGSIEQAHIASRDAISAAIRICELVLVSTAASLADCSSLSSDGCKLCPSLSRVCPSVIATMPADFDCAYLDAFALSLRSVRDDTTSAACEQDMTNSFCGWLSKVADNNQRTQCSGGLADLATAKMCPNDCAAISACLNVPAMWNCDDTFYASSASSPVCMAVYPSSSTGSLTPNSSTPLAPDDTIDGSLGVTAPASSQSLESNLWFVLFLVTASVLVLCAVGSGLYARRLLKQRRVATENLARSNYSVGEPLSVQLGGTDVVPVAAAGGSRTPRANALSPPLRALSPRLLAASSAVASSPLASPTGARSPNPASPATSPNGQIVLPSGSPFTMHLQHMSYPAVSPSPSPPPLPSSSPPPISPPPRDAAIQSPTGYELSRERALGSPSGFTGVSSLSPLPPLPPPARSLPPPPPPPSAPRPQKSPARLLEQMSPKARAGFQRVDG